MAKSGTQARRPNRLRGAVPIAVALAFGALGGAAFAALSLPLPWMLGALAVTTLASVGGLELRVPELLRRPMIAVLGAMLGTTFTPARLDAALSWLPSLAALPLYVVLVGGLIFLYLRRCSDFDPTSAFFAASPGGLSEMIALSDQLGGDQRRVSLVHGARLLFIVSTVPFLAQMFGYQPPDRSPALDLAFDPRALGLLAALGVAGYLLARWLRLPAATFVGPLLGSAAGHILGWIEVAPPAVLMALAQLVLGSAVGARFSGTPVVLIGRTLLLGAGATVIMLLITLAFGGALSALTGHPLTLLLLAFIPGGFTEMSLIALAMGVDPAFVVTHHSVRVFLVVLIALPAFAWLKRAGKLGMSPPIRRHERAIEAERRPVMDKDRHGPHDPPLTR
jgi:membrane AbrB-like protein